MTEFSVITATYNAAETSQNCIESINRQTVSVEHITIDGLSTDNTMNIVTKHQGSSARMISEPDDGIYDAMNKGIQLAGADIIGILNADDFYPAKNTLARVVLAFEDPRIDACYGDLLYVDGKDSTKIIRN